MLQILQLLQLLQLLQILQILQIQMLQSTTLIVGTAESTTYYRVQYVSYGTICYCTNPLYVMRAGSHLTFGFEKTFWDFEKNLGFEKLFGILEKNFPI